jgi:putative ABC transport system ATP-binding protein
MTGADGGPMVRLDGVTKAFRQGEREVRALDGVSLEVPRGQFLAVTGPSGSGKSTLLHLVAGLDTPSGGTIEVAGQAITSLDDDAITLFRRRHLGIVFQFFHLLPTLSAEENVALPLLLDGHRLAAVRPRVARVLELAGLAGRASHRPDELSGGEMQRVAIARALVIEPLVLLADEPTGNLDSRTGGEVLGWLREAAARLGQTVVMVTHDAAAAARGDRVVTLTDGRIVADARVPG